MKQVILRILLLVGLAFGVGVPMAAQTTVGVNIDSGSLILNGYDNMTPLASGDIFQFGYYLNASASDPFSGTFVALTSNGQAGSTNTVIGGDTGSGAGAGQFGYQLTFNLTNPLLPQNGQIMAIMFYNGTTVANSTAYGAASDAGWTWVTPTSQYSLPLTFSLGDANIIWLDNKAGFTGVPEPKTNALIAFGLFLLHMIYRRRTKRFGLGVARQ